MKAGAIALLVGRLKMASPRAPQRSGRSGPFDVFSPQGRLMNRVSLSRLCLALLLPLSLACTGCGNSKSDPAASAGGATGAAGTGSSSGESGGASVASGGGPTGGAALGGAAAAGGAVSEIAAGGVTWHEHIAPLVSEKCAGCHREGGIAPFALTSYDPAYQFALPMAEAIQSGAMPPWGAQETDECTPPAQFRDDVSLSEHEKELFARWVEDGRLEGDAQLAAEIPAPVDLELKDPSLQLTIPSAVSVEGVSDQFVCFVLDPELDEPAWLTSTQVEAGNPAIVHHALVYLDSDGSSDDLVDENGRYDCFGGPRIGNPTLLAAWAPGAVPSSLPQDVGIALAPGAKLVLQVHYHPTGDGVEVDDSTQVSLKWTSDEPDYVGAIYLIGNIDIENWERAGGEGYGLTTGPDFLIPAGASGHVEENRFRINDQGLALVRSIPLHLWMVGTHMHYVGTDMKLSVTSPDDEEQCLLQTPEWDFNWQRGYFFEGEIEELPQLHPGDSLSMRCTYDNTLDNPFVREALDDQGLSEPTDVELGEETLDEMCLGIFGIAVDKDLASLLQF